MSQRGAALLHGSFDYSCEAFRLCCPVCYCNALRYRLECMRRITCAEVRCKHELPERGQGRYGGPGQTPAVVGAALTVHLLTALSPCRGVCQRATQFASMRRKQLDSGGSDLVACVAGDTLRGYLAAAGKSGRHNAGEVVKELTRKQLTDTCAALDKQVAEAVVSVQQAQQAQEQQEDQDADGIHQLGEVLQVLKGAALLATTILAACHTSPPDTLLAAAMSLHDNCLLAVGDLPELQDPVCKLCCSWWELQAPSREQLMAQTLPYILIRAEASGRVGDIKACFAMREAFALLDFEDPTIVDVKRLLLQVSLSPSFLQRQEGRRFLASLFKLDVQLVGELTAIMKNQICSGRKSVLEAYGEIIFRAWKETTGPCLLELETTCIQDLMEAAILASSQPLATALRTVLHGLHSEKRVAGVDALLLRLYRPILFRAFSANNAAVRLNALSLLLDAFPLMDPDAGAEEMEEVLTRQFESLRSCLSDASPQVRCAAVGGVSKLLNLYWELIPAATTAALVRQLTGELAFDMSAPAVRCAVLDGLGPLLDNPHAQPVLRKALPQLAALLSDPSLKVRESMSALLCALSGSRAIHFYDVVPVGLLLDAMSQDSPTVSTRIQSILVPSYFPNPEEGSARVAMLLKANPAAGQAFCAYLVSSWVAASTGARGAGGAGGLGGFRASVPIEHVLQLAMDLKGHLLATAAVVLRAAQAAVEAEKQALEAAARGGGARKKQKKGAGAAGKGAGKKGGKGATGKRRKQPKGSGKGAQGQAEEGGEGGVKVKREGEEDEEDGTQPEEEEEEVIVMEDGETVEGWTAIAGGLSALCFGLAAAVELEQCGQGDMSEVLEEEDLVMLYETCPADEARCSILRIVSLMPYLPAAEAVRSRLLSDIATGKLRLGTGTASAGQGVVTGTADAGEAGAVVDVDDMDQALVAPSLPTSEAVRTLCGHSTGAKLAAMAMSALGLRPAATIHLPAPKPAKKGQGTGRRSKGAQAPLSPEVHGDHDEEDDHRCAVCSLGQPEHSILLCDGCDDAYHMECLQPPLTSIPEGAWFCHRCEQDVQLCTMGWQQALACVSSTVSMQEGRSCLAATGQFVPLLEGLRGMAHQEAQLLLRDVAAGGEGGAGGGARGAGGRAEVVGLYCRTALHLALSTLLDPPPEGGEGGEGRGGAPGAEGEGGDATPASRGSVGRAGAPSGGRPSTDEALMAVVNALNEGVEMCEEVLEVWDAAVGAGAAAGRVGRGLTFGDAEGANDEGDDGEVVQAAGVGSQGQTEGQEEEGPDPGLACRCLDFVGAVLAVVADAQRLAVLDLGAAAGTDAEGEVGAGAQQVARFCKLGARVARVAAAVSPAAAGDRPEGGAGTVAAAAAPMPLGFAGPEMRPGERVRSALRHVLCIALQLVQSVGAAPPSQAGAAVQGEGGAGEGEGGDRGLEPLLREVASAGRQGVGAALGQLDGLASQVLRSVLHPSSGRLLQVLRQPLTSLLAALVDQALLGMSPGQGRNQGGQEAPIHQWLGAVAGAVGRVVAAGGGRGLGEGEEAEEGEGEGKARGKVGQRGKKGGRRGSRARGVSASPEPREDPTKGSQEGEQGEQEEGEGEQEPHGSPSGDGDAAEAAVAAAPGGLLGGGGGPLVVGEQGVVVVCRMLLAMVKGRGSAGRELVVGELASVAGEAWQRGEAELALGAVHLMGLLGCTGMRGRRLRLAGAEVNALLKLEALEEGVALACGQQAGGGEGKGEEPKAKKGRKGRKGRQQEGQAQEGSGGVMQVLAQALQARLG